MKRSITNSFDSNIQDTTIYGPPTLQFDYTGGTYEYTYGHKFIKIFAYSDTSVALPDILTINQSYDQSGTIIVSTDTYTIPYNEIKVFLLEVKSNFYKLSISSTNTSSNIKRIYNTYLLSDDLNIKLYGSGGKEITCDNSGNLNVNVQSGTINVSGSVTAKIQDSSGNTLTSTSGYLNVYNRLLTTTDQITSHIVDTSGNSITSTSGALNINSSVLSNIYTLLNTRGTETLFNNSNSENSPSVNFTNLNIKSITIYGSSSSATTLTIQCSNDNSTWYSSQYTIVLSSGTSFGFGLSGFCPRYLRLHNQNFATSAITAYIDYC